MMGLLFSILLILTIFIIIIPDFLPKMIILIVEIACLLIIFQINHQISLSIDFFLNFLLKSQNISIYSINNINIIMKIEIKSNIIKIFSSLLIILNFFFTIIDLI